MLATIADDYSMPNTFFNADIHRIGTTRRYFCSMLSDKVNCYSFDISFYGYEKKGSGSTMVYTEDSCILLLIVKFRIFLNVSPTTTTISIDIFYVAHCRQLTSVTSRGARNSFLHKYLLNFIIDMRCGRNLARTFLEYYRVMGAIPTERPTELSPKRRPKTHRQRRKLKNVLRERPKTSKHIAVLHLTDLNINYDSETSVDEAPQSYRNIFAPHRHQSAAENEKIVLESTRTSSPPPTMIFVVPEPSLSIIDFNVITRDSIERAARRNRYSVR